MATAGLETPPTEDFLAATFFLDHDTPSVKAFAAETCAGIDGDTARAIALYHAVRDGFRYEAYKVEFTRPGLRASRVIEDGFGFCISKAALLSAAARAMGIPARLGFGDVRNHLTTEKLRASMKTDIFTFHGYSEIFLDGRWVKATPAFNLSLCEKFGVLPLDFDGTTDSLFHPFTADGSKHMEYIRDRGWYADVPFDEIAAAWALDMPGSTDDINRIEGDFAEDGAAERLARP